MRRDDEAAEHVRLILDTANDAFVGIDEDGAVIDWNRRAEQLFGWSRDEAMGRSLADLVIPPHLRERHRAGIQRFVGTGQGRVVFQRLEMPALDRAGRRLDVELTIWPSQSGGRWRFNAFLRDVTASRRERAFVSLLNDVSQAANATFEPEPAVRFALERVCELTGWPLGHAWLLDAGRMCPTGWWHRPTEGFDAFVAETMDTRFDIGVGLPGRVGAEGRPAWIVDVGRDVNFPRMRAAAADDLHSAVAFPVMVGDEVVAALEFLTTDTYASDDRLEELMANVGVQLGRVFERRAAIEHERASAEFRRRMLSVLSHDLRSPAGSIVAFADLLATDWDDLDREGGLDIARRIRRQASRIIDLVSELLTVQRLDAGAMVVDRVPVDVVSRVQEVVDDLALTDDVVLDAPDAVRAHVDAGHLDRMLTNLLANASRHGRPPIEVSVHGDDGRVVIVVRDHGAGIPATMQGRVFQPFARPERTSGTGLGLSIVDGLARRNGGEVEYRSVSGAGATFVLRLPTA